MLTSAYKIFAKAIALKITPALSAWLCAEQKGFIKGRRITEDVISMWEGAEHTESLCQDIVFVKVDFDKAYDRLEWSFILESMEIMGFGPKMINFVRTLLGNAQARVALNNSLSDPFGLSRSVRQGCPLAPLLFAIAVDSLNWLVKLLHVEGIDLSTWSFRLASLKHVTILLSFWNILVPQRSAANIAYHISISRRCLACIAACEVVAFEVLQKLPWCSYLV
ncbi:hypothetical protein L7F22_054047 [Adiantum nelumboides]|nr:hypothetical protein [Adiantum nelumboides]